MCRSVSRWLHQSGAQQSRPYSSVLVVQERQQTRPQKEEALRLAETYAGELCEAVAVGPAHGQSQNANSYFGKGAVEWLQSHIAESAAERVVVNATLNGVQHRNLEQAFGVPVLDRVGLIIEIFGQRARTREARLQVELASLEYRATRLVRARDAESGKKQVFGAGSEVVSARERGRSGGSSGGLGGGGGSGESELQVQRHRIGQRRKALRLKIREVQRTRAVQRAARRRSGKPLIAVVGYTNAGKSSLIEALTGHDLGAADSLFATLDATSRSVHLPSGAAAILSDTVGFISDLPVQLLDAFKGTLEEAVEADLLLHVIDAASPDAPAQHAAVLAILRQLGMTDAQLASKVLEVHNKRDLLEAADAEASDAEGDDAADAAQSLGASVGASAAGAEEDGSLLDSATAGQAPGPGADPSAAQRHEAAADHPQQPQQQQQQQQQSTEKVSIAADGAAPTPARVSVSAATGKGLRILLQEIDRKVSFRSSMDVLAANQTTLRYQLQSMTAPPRPTRQQRSQAAADEPWRPGWPVEEHSSLAARVFCCR